MCILPFIGKKENTRDTARNDFVSYRPFYGILPPEHEPNIHLGDIGRFNRDGEFIKLGNLFQEYSFRAKGDRDSDMDVGLLGVPRPDLEQWRMSEEMVFDPFISRRTGWTNVPEDQLEEIKFLCLKRADRNSLTYEYVHPRAAVRLRQLKKNRWGHALLVGGPLQRNELHDFKLDLWLQRNSKILRRTLDSLEKEEVDKEYGLVVVMTLFTSPGYMDVKFRDTSDGFAPIVLGCTACGDSMRWLRGYPTNDGANAFDGEVITHEGPTVDGGWTMFLDGYSITRAPILRRLLQHLYDILRSSERKTKAHWKKDVNIAKISDIYT